jgi:hypothetical protein
MFIANFEIFKKWFLEMNIIDLTYNKFPDGYYSEQNIAHDLEKIFGLVPNMFKKGIVKIII